MIWTAVLLTIAASLAVLAWRSKSSWGKLCLVYSAAFCGAIGLFEAYLALQQQLQGDGTRMDGSITEDFTHPDDLLGYAPAKDRRVTARKWYGGSLIYDVVYTIGSDGLRIAPPPAASAAKGCLIFFGDSITFGEGVNDEEPFPYRIGVKTAGEYRIHNFAFSGYGPHQMLANLQLHRVDEIVRCTPTHFIYFCIPEHTERVAGLAAWDRHGPRFRLAADGSVFRDGNFDGPSAVPGSWTMPQWAQKGLDGFLAWQTFFGRLRQAGPKDLALLIAIVRQAARTAKQRHPGSEFDVILWDGSDNDRVRSIESGLAGAGIPVHRLTSAIPDFRTHWQEYVLSMHDLHPNALQHERVADYVITNILKNRQYHASDGAR